MGRHLVLVPSLLIAAGLVRAADQPSIAAPGPTGDASTLVVAGEQDADPRHVESTRSALFGDRRLIETPFSIASYNRTLIEDQRAFTTAEVLRNDPSVYIAWGGGSYGYYDSFGIRGFEGHNNLSYRVDGLSFSNQGETAIDNKERIDVLKGPAALRFGFMPSGGAFNFVRKRPTDTPTASISLDGDSFGRLYTQADFGGRLGGTGVGSVGYRVVAAGEKIDSFWDDAGGERVFASAFVDWRITQAITGWISLEKHDRRALPGSGVLISESGVIFDHRGTDANYTEDWSYYETHQDNAQVGADVVISADWSLHLTGAFNDFARDNSQSYAGQVFDNGDYEVYEYTTFGETRPHWSYQAHVEGRFGTGPFTHDVAVGGLYRRHRMTYGDGVYVLRGTSNVFAPVGFGRTGTEPPPSTEAFFAEETGLFATDTVQITRHWSALLGVRWARFDSVSRDTTTGLRTGGYDEAAVSPTAAVMFAPVEGIHTYALYTQGLQPGGVAPSTTTNANEEQPPIASRQIEVGAKAETVDGRLSGEIALFRIAQDLEYTNASNTYVQDGSQEHQGVELAVRGHLSDPLTVGLATTFLDAQQDGVSDPTVDGKRPANVADYQANAWIAYDVPQIDGLTLTMTAYAVGERFADSAQGLALDEYVVLNAGVRYRFRAAEARWTARCLVENLTDEEYFSSGSWWAGYGGSAYYGSPLAVRLSLQADF